MRRPRAHVRWPLASHALRILRASLVVAEPVFGQMKTTHRAARLLLRGHGNARAEWRLLDACHNLRKLFSYTNTAQLATG